MKILYLHNVRIREQTANLTQVISMCNAFSELGHSVTLALGVDSKQNVNKTFQIVRNDYSVHKKIEITPIINPIPSDKLAKFSNHFFIKSILKQGFDICYTRDVNFLEVSLRNGIKTFYESHNNKIHIGSGLIDAFLKSKLKKCVKHKNFIKLVAISDNLSNYWREFGIKSSKLVALHDGFSSNKYSTEISIIEAREKLNISNEIFLVNYTGNLYPNRGVNKVIELAKAFPKVVFFMIGGPEKYIPELKEKSTSLNNINFVGPVPYEKIHLYQFAANINLGVWSSKVPTIDYCSPLKIFEYMAVNRPIVAMGFKTIREVLKDGENAYVAKPDDIEDLKLKLRNAINDGRKAVTSRKEAFQKYSWEKRAEKIMSYVR